MNICLFSAEEISKPLPWNDERAQHIIKVLHKKENDSFTAGIIEGQSGKATITKINEKESIEFSFENTGNGKPLYPLSMIIGFPRPIQLKRLLRDIAGLGSGFVHLTGTELGEKSYLQSTLVEKGAAYKMLLDGTVQAGSTHVPKLFMHKSLSECLDSCFDSFFEHGTTANRSEENIPTFKIALDNVGAKCALKDFIEQKLATIPQLAEQQTFTMNSNEQIVTPKFKAIAAIGSERGWTEKERNLLESQGFTRCSMGTRILRTESAATVAASIILNYMGVLN